MMRSKVWFIPAGTGTRRLLAAVALAAILSARLGAQNQEPLDGDGDLAEITQTVARVSYLDGDVSYARGDDPDHWQSADRNLPMTLGDRVYTAGNARIELQLHGGDVIWLGSGSDLTALNLTEETRQFALKSGIAFFRVSGLGPNEIFEIDSPNAAVTFGRSGDYRIDVDADGNTLVSVARGTATIAAGGGQVSVGAHAGIRIDGLDAPRYEVVALPEVDAWDRWIGQRESRVLTSRSRRYVSAAVAGVEDLDDYGRWTQLPRYGWVWSPTSAAAGWAPYRAGRWIWQDPWGWTWVSTEPWGWAPYHSGRWIFVSARWCWVPVAPAVRIVHYAPALVAFVGGGPGFSASLTIGGGTGFVGWFPLAPRDPLLPWWGYRTAPRVTQVTNVTYVNRTHVTVVDQSTFVSGRPVIGDVITERSVVRQASEAPVVRGPIPVAPTVASTRASDRTNASAARPPSKVASRPVVARVAPPPAPPRFEEKVAMIRQNGGAPVSPAASARLSVEGSPRPRAATDVRPAAMEKGNVTLSPRGSSTESKPQSVEPIVPPKGHALATEARPVVPGHSTQPSVERPQRPQDQGRRELPEASGRDSKPGTGPVSPEQPPDVRRPRNDAAPESAQPPRVQSEPRAIAPGRPEPKTAPKAFSSEPQKRGRDAGRNPEPPRADTTDQKKRVQSASPQGREHSAPAPTARQTTEQQRSTSDPGTTAKRPRKDEKAKGREQAHPTRRPTPAPPDSNRADEP